MREMSYRRRNWWLLLVGLLVGIGVVIGGSIILVRARTQIPQGRACGEITLPGGGLWNSALAYQGGTLSQVEQCFVQAYRQCQNASISVTLMGVDAGTDETFTVVSQQGQCQIFSSSQPYRVGIQSPQSTTDACQGLTKTTVSLVVKHCGNDGDKTIPLAEFCGIVSSAAQAGENKKVEDCFVQHKQQCNPAGLIYEAASSGLSSQFEIDSTCHIFWKANSDAPAIICAGMLQEGDELHFHDCGSSGEILVPVNP